MPKNHRQPIDSTTSPVRAGAITAAEDDTAAQRPTMRGICAFGTDEARMAMESTAMVAPPMPAMMRPAMRTPKCELAAQSTEPSAKSTMPAT